MARFFSPSWLIFIIAAWFYCLATYLLLLSDAFILERLALSFSQPRLEILGLALSTTLHAPTLGLIILCLALFFLVFAYFSLLRHRQSLSFKHLLFLSLPFLLSFPALSTDVFDYNNVNRVVFIHHANPWTTPANHFPQDDTIYYGNWRDRPTIYPPVSLLSFSLVHLFTGSQIPQALICFKLFNLGLFVGLFFLLQKLHLKQAPLLLLAHPLMLIEFLGNSHNDLFVGVASLLCFILLLRTRFFSAGTTLALAIFSKITALFYLPFIIVHFLFHRPRHTLRFLLGLLSTSLIFALPLLPVSSSYLTNLSSQSSYQLHSLPFITRATILATTSNTLDQATHNSSLVTYALLAAAYLYLLASHRSRPLIHTAIYSIVSYLFIASPMIQPWYLGWFLPLLVLLKPSRLRISLIVTSLTVLSLYPLHSLSLRFFLHHPLWQLTSYLTVTLPPFLVLFLPQSWYTRLHQQINSLP